MNRASRLCLPNEAAEFKTNIVDETENFELEFSRNIRKLNIKQQHQSESSLRVHKIPFPLLLKANIAEFAI